METCVVAVRCARSFLPNEVRSSAVLCQAFVCGTYISRMAGMVISGSGPNLHSELVGSTSPTGFAVPDQSIMRPFGSSTSQHIFTEIGCASAVAS